MQPVCRPVVGSAGTSAQPRFAATSHDHRPPAAKSLRLRVRGRRFSVRSVLVTLAPDSFAA